MKEKIFNMKTADIYNALLLNKYLRKNKSKKELNAIITWLTGYSEDKINGLINSDISYGYFFLMQKLILQVN